MAESEQKDAELDREAPPKEAGFIKFYGLYWDKSVVGWLDGELLGQPPGWMGKGKPPKDFDRKTVQMNFWNQQGVYILYDANLQPVYAGQAGLSKKGNAEGGQNIGNRLLTHSRGIYRNGWSLFSWFGFLETSKISLKSASDDSRLKPKWTFPDPGNSELNLLLASFEAVLIEGFSPRFNSRGGDLSSGLID